MYFYQYSDGKWELANGVGSTPESKGYYYLENSDGSMQLYFAKGGGDYQAINYHGNNVVDSAGNLHEFDNTDSVSRSYTDAAAESSGHISDENIEGFDPPAASGADNQGGDGGDLPPVVDRRDDRLEPGEKLVPAGSEEVTDGEARSSIANGDYTLTLNEDNELILADKAGNKLWGYSGADAANLLSGNFEVKIGPDGSIKLLDPETHAVMRTIREASDAKHAELVLLHHPLGGENLRRPIDEAQTTLQLQVDCFGKGQATLAEDVGDWLHNQGLIDEDNSASITTSYNNEYLSYDTSVKKHFKDLDEKIRTIAVKTDLVNSEAFKKITTAAAELNEVLRGIDYKDTEVKSVGEMGYHTYRQILPDIESDLLDLIAKTVETVDEVVDNANQANEESEAAADEESPWYQTLIRSGRQAGYEEGLVAGGADEAAAVDIDWSSTFADLLAGADSAAADDTSALDSGTEAAATGADSVAATGADSAVLSAINSAIDRIESGATSSGSGSDSSGSTSGDSATSGTGAGTGSSDLSNMMQMMQMMNQNQNQRSRSSDERSADDSYYEQIGDDQAAALATPAAAVTPAAPADPAAGALAATPVPPTISASNSMVDMQLPGDSPQKVSSTVAQAVNKELNNPNGSDARAAYTGTPGQESTWTTVEGEPKTGDVALWENRSGLLVVDSSGRLQIIVDGEPTQLLDTKNPPGGGEAVYGAFLGYRHPSGADLDTAAQLSTALPAPSAVTAAPVTPAAPPAVTAPAAI